MNITETFDIIYELGSVWKKGIIHLPMSPLELIGKLVASIVPADVIKTILAHLSLRPQPPPIAQARSTQLFLV